MTTSRHCFWLQQLNDAIEVLSANLDTEQESYGNADLFYQSDWTKWIKLANTLKLRLAVRLENQDAARTAQIFQSVMQDPIGPINSDEAQMIYSNDTYTPFGTGGDIDYRSRRFASQNVVSFLKRTQDPRLSLNFDANDLIGNFQDSLAKYEVTLPDFIAPADPLVQYQGGPPDWTLEPEKATYFNNALAVGPNRYFLISSVNRRFFSPKLNNATGIFTDVVVSHAETCFYIAEGIVKGYISGSAAEWYKQGKDQVYF